MPITANYCLLLPITVYTGLLYPNKAVIDGSHNAYAKDLEHVSVTLTGS